VLSDRNCEEGRIPGRFHQLSFLLGSTAFLVGSVTSLYRGQNAHMVSFRRYRSLVWAVGTLTIGAALSTIALTAPSTADFAFQNTRRSQAVRTIAQQFQMKVARADRASGRVTLRLVHVSLDQGLRAVLSGTGLTYARAGSTLVIEATARPPQAIPTTFPAVVLPVTIIEASRAAQELSVLYPQARVAVDRSANALIVIASPDTIGAMRAVLQGIDVRSPLRPTTEALQLHVVAPADVARRLQRLYPAARIGAGPNHTLLVTATQTDMAQIRTLVSTLDAPPTPSPAPQRTPSTSQAIHLTQARASTVARQVAGSIAGLQVKVAGDSVVLIGSPEDVNRARDLVAVLDQPPSGVQFTQVYRLRTLDAQSVGDLIGRSFADVRVTIDKDDNAITVLANTAEQKRIADAVSQLDSAGASGAGNPGAGQPGTVAQFVGPNGGFEIYTMRAALPGPNGAASTSATEISQTVTQALQAAAPDLHITVAPNQQQLIIAGNPYSIKLAKDLIEQLDVAQKLGKRLLGTVLS